MGPDRTEGYPRPGLPGLVESLIDVERCQIAISYTAGVHRELCEQFIAARNGKPPWSTKAFVLTVPQIHHHAVVRSGIFADGLHDEYPQDWTRQALKTLEEATESYMVEVIAESFIWKQQLIKIAHAEV